MLDNLTKTIDSLYKAQVSSTRGVYQGKMNSFIDRNPKYITERHSVLTIGRGLKPKETPYSSYYSEETYKVIEAIKEIRDNAEDELANEWWQHYLNKAIYSFKTDDWKELEKEYLNFNRDHKYHLTIGPIESYHDKYYGYKKFFSLWFLEKNEESDYFISIWDKLLQIAKENTHYLTLNDDIGKIKQPNLFIGDLINEGGEVKELGATGWSRPEDTDVAMRYGTIKVIAVNKYRKKFEKLEKEVNKYLGKWGLEDKIKFKKDELYKIQLLSLIIHEFAHTFLKPLNSRERLGKYYPMLEELRAEANTFYLHNELSKRAITPKDWGLKSLFVSNTGYLFYPFLKNHFDNTGEREVYLNASQMHIFLSKQWGYWKHNNKKIDFNLDTIEKSSWMYSRELLNFTNTLLYFGTSRNDYMEKLIKLLHSQKLS